MIGSSFGLGFTILLAVLAIVWLLIMSCHFLRFRVIYGRKTHRCRMTLRSSLLSSAGPQTQSGAEFCYSCKLSTPPVCSTTPPTPFSTTYCYAQYSPPLKPFTSATLYSGTPASTASTAHDALGFAIVFSTPRFTSLYFTHILLNLCTYWISFCHSSYVRYIFCSTYYCRPYYHSITVKIFVWFIFFYMFSYPSYPFLYKSWQSASFPLDTRNSHNTHFYCEFSLWQDATFK